MVLFIFILNFLIIKILFNNLLTIIKNKKDVEAKFIKLIIIYFLSVGMLLIFKQALWQVIKLYMYFSVFFLLFNNY